MFETVAKITIILNQKLFPKTVSENERSRFCGGMGKCVIFATK